MKIIIAIIAGIVLGSYIEWTITEINNLFENVESLQRQINDHNGLVKPDV